MLPPWRRMCSSTRRLSGRRRRPPEQVSSTNVALMGRDVGIIGATIALPLYPTGIHKFTV